MIDELYTHLRHTRTKLYRIFIWTARLGLPIVFFAIFLGNLHYFSVRWHYKLGIYDEPTYIKEIGGQ